MKFILKNTLPQHEWIGLSVKIVAAADSHMVGFEGRVVDETKNLVIIEVEGVEKKIPKKGTVFEFTIEDKKTRLDGSKYLFRPEDRVKRAWLARKKRAKNIGI